MKSSCLYGLAIHTASSELGLAVSNFASDRRSQTWNLGRETSHWLHSHLVEFLQPQTWQNLGFIAVAKGPGGFTGTRIGVVTARTLAQQLEMPLFAVSTLAGVAWDAGKALALATPEVNIAVQMPARRGEIFCAVYCLTLVTETRTQPESLNYDKQIANLTITTVLPDQVRTQDDWQAVLTEGNKIDHLVELAEGSSSSVMSILEIGYRGWLQGDRPHWSEALPFYGQHPVRD